MNHDVGDGNIWIQNVIQTLINRAGAQFEWETCCGPVHKLSVICENKQIGAPLEFSDWELFLCQDNTAQELRRHIMEKLNRWRRDIVAHSTSPIEALERRCPKCWSEEIFSRPVLPPGSRASGGVAQATSLFGQVNPQLLWECADCGWVLEP